MARRQAWGDTSAEEEEGSVSEPSFSPAKSNEQELPGVEFEHFSPRKELVRHQVHRPSLSLHKLSVL